MTTPEPDENTAGDGSAGGLSETPLFEADPDTKARVAGEAERRAEMARWDASAGAPSATGTVLVGSREGMCRFEARWRPDGKPCPRVVEVGKSASPGVSGRTKMYCGLPDTDAAGNPVGPAHTAVEAGIMRRREGREKRVAAGAPVASTTVPVSDGTTKLESLYLAIKAEVEGAVTAIDAAAERAATRVRQAGDLIGDITDLSAAPTEIQTIQNKANDRVLEAERKAREALLAREQALADLAANDEATEQLEERTRVAEDAGRAAEEARQQAVADAERAVEQARTQTEAAEEAARAARTDRDEKVAAAARSVEQAQQQADVDVKAAGADRDRRVADMRDETDREVALARSRAEQEVAAVETRARAEVAAAGEMANARIAAAQIKADAADAARAAAEVRAGELQQAATEADARARENGQKAERDLAHLRAEHSAALEREQQSSQRETAALSKALSLAEAELERLRAQVESGGGPEAGG